MNRSFMLIGLLLLTNACSGTVAEERVDPLVLAVEQGATAIEAAIERGQAAGEELDTVRFRIRFNPAGCSCPVWEIALRGRWTRVFLAVDPAIQEQLEAMTDRAQSALQAGQYLIYLVEGHLGSELTIAETSMRYRTLQVVGFPELRTAGVDCRAVRNPQDAPFLCYDPGDAFV